MKTTSKRDYKIFAPGEHYHVFNRGNAKMDIFLEPEDYGFFIRRLHEALFPESADGAHPQKRKSRYERTQLPDGAFSLVSYCLMPNHYHLLVRQNSDLPVSALLLKVCSGYGKYFNKKYKRVGSLFQDQFKAVRVDGNTYLLYVSMYIHQNPVVAQLVKRAEEYVYSSYPDYLGLRDGSLCEKGIIMEQFSSLENYRTFVGGNPEVAEQEGLNAYLIDAYE